MNMPTTGIAQYITKLAQAHGVQYSMTTNDALAGAITRLADDSVELDEIELLLLALERASVIASENIVPLHINYLREKLNTQNGQT